ncbi:MAG: DUF4382 domain-containing protein [Syntrophales bacterium]
MKKMIIRSRALFNIQTKLTKSVLPYFAAALIFLIAGCGGGGDSSPQAGTGTLGVSLTDAPAGGFTAVNVTISKVRVHKSSSASENDAGWTDITLAPARKINLLNITNGVLDDLGTTPLSAGHYTQLRLVLVATNGTNLANSVVLTSDPATEIALDTPSAVQSGIKLINEFDVASGQRVDLVLDFDALKSVVARGNGTYLLKPVIKVVPTQLNGIDGFVDTAILGSNVLVSAQSNGIVMCSAAPNQLGEFFLSRLAPGNYDVVITANGRATAVITGVPVASTASTTIVSTSSARFTLPTSTTKNVNGAITLNPASTTAATFVTAMQTFGSSPIVTVTSKAVDPSSGVPAGGYLLTLPVDAPLLGQYGTGTLPIALTAQASVAGKYTIAASADGYKTQSASKDISVADATQNFTLAP